MKIALQGTTPTISALLHVGSCNGVIQFINNLSGDVHSSGNPVQCSTKFKFVLTVCGVVRLIQYSRGVYNIGHAPTHVFTKRVVPMQSCTMHAPKKSDLLIVRWCKITITWDMAMWPLYREVAFI